ncbi:hypothetical protein J3R30DRAFT_2875038 [Lentinula aciculospora]|uniref:Uncharacterized protein n=1 Tax=Lentinula aciculospora TaxID=153920 RepID=A0A9W9ABK9_9AGAR|nr:hypothetical protein J3R30DRAFT_2875038 [Lentinula aciculospora]
MRRFASVFISSKREKNEKTSRRTTLNVRTQPASSDITTFDSSLSTPQLSAGGSEPAQSSASSAGSVNLQTPEDIPISRVNSKKTWIPWRAKKSDTIKVNNRSEPNWTPLPPPLLRSPPPGARVTIDTPNDPDSDSDSDEYGEEDARLIKPVLAKPIITPASQSKAQAVLQALIQNSLVNRSSSAPFVVQPGAPLYPRSCNRPRSLPSTNSLARTVLKRRMLQRLQNVKLTPFEAEEIIAFSTRDISKTEPHTSLDMINERALSTSDRTVLYSVGLRSWIDRPPFEDRFSVWSAVDGNITCQRVLNTPGFALAALEFSQAIEVKADLFGDPLPSHSSTELQVSARSASVSDVPSSSSSASSHISSSASHSRSIPSPQLLAPSPLRNQASSLSASSSSDGPRKESLLQVPSPVSSASKNMMPSRPPASMSDVAETPPSVATPGTVKRGVRFIEEDKDENVPVGYIMRNKKQREEKARFLREQKEKRQFEEERARVEEERKQRDAERRKWEQERQAWEKEKRAIEEERKRKQYTVDVAAARQRAESSRIGMRSSSSASLREPERNISASQRLSRGSEGLPSPRRQASELFPRDHSPANSRPPSIASGAGYFPINSRPSSIHSSEDVRSLRPQSTALYIPPIPPVPPIPQYYSPQSTFPLDMPLLPPTAPFMVNQFSRRQSQSPQSSSRQRVPSNSSTESVNRYSVHGRQGSSPRDSSNSSSSSPHRTHQRRTSDDSTRRTSTYSTLPHSLSSSHLPRGRPTNPAHIQQTLPSPWTAPPTLHGGPPSAYSGINTVTRHTPSRRQTTFS